MTLLAKTRSAKLLLGAVSAIVAGALVLSLASTSSSSQPIPDVSVRGDLVDPASFSLSGLHDESDLRAVDDAHTAAMSQCMADRGFGEQPENREGELSGDALAAFADANPDATFDSFLGEEREALAEWQFDAIGGDEIHTVVIEVPGAKIAEGGFPVSASWTPQTCFWQSYEGRGTEPYYYIGVGMLVQSLRNQADTAAIEDGRFSDVAGDWARCSERDEYSLIREINRSEADPLPAIPRCLATVDVEALQRLVGEHHSRVAADNQPLIDEYVAVVDRAIEATFS